MMQLSYDLVENKKAGLENLKKNKNETRQQRRKKKVTFLGKLHVLRNGGRQTLGIIQKKVFF